MLHRLDIKAGRRGKSVKEIILFSLFFFKSFFVYSQDLPSWVRVGMTRDELLRNGATISKSDESDWYAFITEEGHVYRLYIESTKGLSIVVESDGSSLDFNKITARFSSKYGNPTVRNNNYYYRQNLPRDVEMITMSISGEITLCFYYLKDSFF
jgi:hypothetical protein